MSKHEAVDRLMALATEKRADRVPDGPPAGTAIEDTPLASNDGIPPTVGDHSTVRPESQANPTGADRGRQLLQAIRPLLPAVAGAMRLVDHGAVQAVARLLPLLGGSAQATLSTEREKAQEKAEAQRSRAANDLQFDHQALRKEVQAMALQLAALDDLLGRTRSHLERLAAEQVVRDGDVRALGDRVRLLSAGLIILIMLVVIQMILLVVVLHK